MAARRPFAFIPRLAKSAVAVLPKLDPTTIGTTAAGSKNSLIGKQDSEPDYDGTGLNNCSQRGAYHDPKQRRRRNCDNGLNGRMFTERPECMPHQVESE